MAEVRLGPDAARYILAGQGQAVARPFHLRFLLPMLCRDDLRRWRVVWLASWPLCAAGCVWWAVGMGADWWSAVAAAVLLVALPGVWGPISVRPVGVDLPAMALSLWSAAFFAHGWWPAGLTVVVVAGCVKETSPALVALWAWTPLPLVALAVPAVVYLIRRPQLDPVTANTPILRHVHDHPIRSAWEHHQHQWRNAWVMVAPWGVCLAALVHPSAQVIVALVAAYGILLVVTDTVRVYQHIAGPVMALAAAQVIPPGWLLLAVAVHVCWWRDPVVG